MREWYHKAYSHWSKQELLGHIKFIQGEIRNYFHELDARDDAHLHAEIKKLTEDNIELRKDNYELLQEIERLKTSLARANKNASNSSKPPSSDITKPTKNKSSSKRKKGGQKGHPKWERKSFAESEIDKQHTYTLKNCPCCKDTLSANDRKDECLQQIEKVEKPYTVTEHRSKVYWCSSCQKHVWKPVPDRIAKLGLFGPRLTAEVALLKSEGHMSYSAIQTFLNDVYGIKVARGFLAKIIKRASQSIAAPVKDLERRLWTEPHLNIDETGHKENGDKYWTWCFRARSYAFFSVVGSRNTEELLRVLTKDFAGVIGSDLHGSYIKFARLADIKLQLCWAHLIRDIKFLTTLENKGTQKYGERLLDQARKLFNIIHNASSLTSEKTITQLKEVKKQTLKMAQENIPADEDSKRMAGRFKRVGELYFNFIGSPEIHPTNNIAEQTIRFVTIDRRITQGTRSAVGRWWCSRIWSARATCRIQNKSLFEFLHQAILANAMGKPPPSLLPN